MSTIKTTDTKSLTNGNPPALPPNVFIFSPATPLAAKALLNSRMFTRLTIGGQTNLSQLVEALNSEQWPDVDESFCFCHRNIVLIFDSEAEGKDLQDAHHEHFRAVCLVLKDKSINLDVAGCVFDAPIAVQAGFQLEELSSGSVLAIDIMGGESGSDDDEEDSDLDDGGVEWFPMNEDLELPKS